jgi:putative hydrolase of the HAD superfamily
MRTAMPIKAVTFDVGGTLIEPWVSVGHVYSEVATRHGVKNITPELLNARFRTAWTARRSFGDSRADWEALVDEVFQGLAAEPPRTTFFPELYERFAEADAWRVFDDVLPTLKALSARGVRLAALSNWDERLRVLLDRLGLEVFFEAIIVSCEVGALKPSPVIFRQAVAKLGLPPEAILHVGDSFEMDVQGARNAGLASVQVMRQKTPAPPADGQISSLRDVLTMV